MSARAGFFITLEGGEGAGKSTCAKLLAESLMAAGRDVIVTREPGGTAGAEAVRGLLLGDVPLTPLAQAMLLFGARADHVAGVIRPAIADGKIVICDRFYDSTMAYQSFGLGVDVAAVASLIRLINLRPDLTFVMQVPPDIGRARVAARDGGGDRYERMDAAFFERVENGFRSIAAAEPGRCVVVDAVLPVAEVVAGMVAAVQSRL